LLCFLLSRPLGAPVAPVSTGGATDADANSRRNDWRCPLVDQDAAVGRRAPPRHPTDGALTSPAAERRTGHWRCPAAAGGALRARERVQGAAAAAGGVERRFRALAGGPRAARARHGRSARFVNA